MQNNWVLFYGKILQRDAFLVVLRATQTFAALLSAERRGVEVEGRDSYIRTKVKGTLLHCTL